MHDFLARQRFRQLAALLFRRGGFLCRLMFRRRLCLRRSPRLGLRRFQLFELQLELLQLAVHAFGRGAKGHALQPRDLDFQLFDLERLCDKASLGGGKLRTFRNKKAL